MKEKFTIICSFRNRLAEVIRLINSIDKTSSKDVDIMLVDAASDDDVIRSLRTHCNTIIDRKIRICETSYRTTIEEAWNLGMMLTDTRYAIIVSSDVDFTKSGWEAVFKTEMIDKKGQYVLMNNHAVFCLDKKIISKIGWFDEHYLSGPHFDPDYMIRATEAKIPIRIIPVRDFYIHGYDEDGTVAERLNEDVSDRLPMNCFENEEIFRTKWKSDWPGWKQAIVEKRPDLPHPPTHIGSVTRTRLEIDPHPIWSRKYK